MRTARNLSSGTYTDGILIPKINSVSKRVQDICCRKFGFQRFSGDSYLFMAGNGLDRIWVNCRPIRSITYVAIGDEEQTVADFTLAGAQENAGYVFRTADWDVEGKLYRPSRWPASVRMHRDLTCAPDWSGPKGYSIAIQGDFGMILPQFDGVVNATHNPDGEDTDMDPTLEDLVWTEVQETLASRPAPGIKSETTAGGRKKDFQDATYLAQRESFFRSQLEPFCNPEAFLP